MRSLSLGVAACLIALSSGCSTEPATDEPAEGDTVGGGGKADGCGADNSQPAACFEKEDPGIYATARGVVRLHMIGDEWCSGFLVGDQGHVLTNHHCVRTQSTADQTEVQVMAEGMTCETICSTPGSCPGKILATSATIVKTSFDYDYTLLKLAAPLPPDTGYLTLRRAGATTGERIFIPQHPEGQGKRIAVMADQAFATIMGRTEGPPHPCLGIGPNVEYRAETEPGSSGSPVIAYSDRAVVALHHCGGCTAGGANRGIPIEDVIADLGDVLPATAFSSPAAP